MNVKFEKSQKIYVRRKVSKRLPGDDAEYIEKIGSSLRNGVINRGLEPAEEVLYLPTLVGSDPSKADWAKATEDYWKNISVNVPDTDAGLELEVGFKFKNEEDMKANINGTPINIPNYVLYKYCLVYSKVANSIDLIGKSPNIRFYLHSLEAEQKTKLSEIQISQKAFKAYLKILDDKILINNVLLLMNVGKNVSMKDEDKAIALHSIVKDRPNEFLKVLEDPYIELKSLIQTAVASKVLTLSPNTEIYMRGDEIVARNTMELISYLNSQEGQNLKTILETQLKQLK